MVRFGATIKSARAAPALVVVAALVSAVHAASSDWNEAARATGVPPVSSLSVQIAGPPARSQAPHLARPTEDAALAALARTGKPLFCGGTRRYSALTFDDGPSASSSRLLRMLRRVGVPATFFVTGQRLQLRPAVLPALVQSGAVGNHTWNHPMLTRLSRRDMIAQLTSTNSLLAANSPRHVPPYRMMRPPYGDHNDAVDRTLRDLGYAQLLWSADSQDALGKQWRDVAHNVIAGLGPGAVILMHDGPPATLTALRRRILPAIRRRKLTMVTVPELLVLNPPGRKRLAQGPHGCAHTGTINVSGYFTSPRGER